MLSKTLLARLPDRMGVFALPKIGTYRIDWVTSDLIGSCPNNPIL